MTRLTHAECPLPPRLISRRQREQSGGKSRSSDNGQLRVAVRMASAGVRRLVRPFSYCTLFCISLDKRPAMSVACRLPAGQVSAAKLADIAFLGVLHVSHEYEIQFLCRSPHMSTGRWRASSRWRSRFQPTLEGSAQTYDSFKMPAVLSLSLAVFYLPHPRRKLHRPKRLIAEPLNALKRKRWCRSLLGLLPGVPPGYHDRDIKRDVDRRASEPGPRT